MSINIVISSGKSHRLDVILHTMPALLPKQQEHTRHAATALQESRLIITKTQSKHNYYRTTVKFLPSAKYSLKTINGRGLHLIYILITLSVMAILFVIFQNRAIRITYYKLTVPISKQLRIAHLSDLHLAMFGKNQSALIKKVRSSNPDIIAFTGDLIKKTSSRTEPSLTLMKELVKCAPVYMCFGNHEAVSAQSEQLYEELNRIGVHLLLNESAEIREDITVTGLKDYTVKGMKMPRKIMIPEDALNKCRSSNYSIVLSHRPELAQQYANAGTDLVLCGHAHGGLVALPFNKRLFTPDEGFFPHYAYGKYTIGSTIMIVNAGLGFTGVPARIFNRPEIGIIDLVSDK